MQTTPRWIARRYLRGLNGTVKGQRMADHGRAKDVPTITEVLSDPTASLWLKRALRPAFFRDLVDAANDSEILASLLEQRCNQLLLDD